MSDMHDRISALSPTEYIPMEGVGIPSMVKAGDGQILAGGGSISANSDSTLRIVGSTNTDGAYFYPSAAWNLHGMSSWTIMGFFVPEYTQRMMPLIEIGVNQNIGAIFDLRVYVSGDNSLRFSRSNTGGAEHTVLSSGSGSVKVGKAHHFVVTDDGTTMKLFLNGRKVAEDFSAQGISGGARYALINSLVGTNGNHRRTFRGSVGHFATWSNRALTEREIASLYFKTSTLVCNLAPPPDLKSADLFNGIALGNCNMVSISDTRLATFRKSGAGGIFYIIDYDPDAGSFSITESAVAWSFIYTQIYVVSETKILFLSISDSLGTHLAVYDISSNVLGDIQIIPNSRDGSLICEMSAGLTVFHRTRVGDYKNCYTTTVSVSGMDVIFGQTNLLYDNSGQENYDYFFFTEIPGVINKVALFMFSVTNIGNSAMFVKVAITDGSGLGDFYYLTDSAFNYFNWSLAGSDDGSRLIMTYPISSSFTGDVVRVGWAKFNVSGLSISFDQSEFTKGNFSSRVVGNPFHVKYNKKKDAFYIFGKNDYSPGKLATCQKIDENIKNYAYEVMWSDKIINGAANAATFANPKSIIEHEDGFYFLWHDNFQGSGMAYAVPNEPTYQDVLLLDVPTNYFELSQLLDNFNKYPSSYALQTAPSLYNIGTGLWESQAVDIMGDGKPVVRSTGFPTIQSTLEFEDYNGGPDYISMTNATWLMHFNLSQDEGSIQTLTECRSKNLTPNETYFRIQIELDGSVTLISQKDDNSGEEVKSRYDYGLSANMLHQLAIIRKDDTLYVYIDAILAMSFVVNNAFTPSRQTWIIGNSRDGLTPLVGGLGHVVFYGTSKEQVFLETVMRYTRSVASCENHSWITDPDIPVIDPEEQAFDGGASLLSDLRPGAASSEFAGALGHVSTFNKALSADEVADIFNSYLAWGYQSPETPNLPTIDPKNDGTADGDPLTFVHWGYGVRGEAAQYNGFALYGHNSLGKAIFAHSDGDSAIYAYNTANFDCAQFVSENWTGVVAESRNGTYSFYSRSGVVGPFTGAHDALIQKNEFFEAGDIVTIVKIVCKNGISDVLPQVQVCSTSDSKAAYGVITRSNPVRNYRERNNGENHCDVASMRSLDKAAHEAIQKQYELASINAIGEGQINVCSANGDIEMGDFISTSPIRGKGQKYDGVDIRCVVAKAMEPVDWSQESSTTKMIACIYMSG